MSDVDGKEPTPQPEPGKEPAKAVPYDRFAAVNQEKKELEARLTKLEQERKQQQEKVLKDQEKWKELAEQREKELARTQLETTRLRVAMAKGLPLDMADRLRGASEEEMMADAETLLPLLQPKTPGTPPPAARGNGKIEITSEQLSDPAWVRENMQKVLKGAQS